MSEATAWARVFESFFLADAQLLVAALGSSGIPNRLLGDSLAPLMGEIPGTIPMVSVEVPEDRRDDAMQIIERRFPAPGAQKDEVKESWTCAGCAELNPGEFDVCWHE